MELFKKLRIKDIMVTPVFTIFEEDGVSEAHEKFIAHGISYLCVVDHSDRLVGIISRKYLYRAQSPLKIIDGQNIYDKNIILDGDSYFDKAMLAGINLKAIMQREPLTMGPNDSVAEAIIQMARKKIGCIPVLDTNRKILGILTNQDVVNVTADLLQQK